MPALNFSSVHHVAADVVIIIPVVVVVIPFFYSVRLRRATSVFSSDVLCALPHYASFLLFSRAYGYCAAVPISRYHHGYPLDVWSIIISFRVAGLAPGSIHDSLHTDVSIRATVLLFPYCLTCAIPEATVAFVSCRVYCLDPRDISSTLLARRSSFSSSFPLVPSSQMTAHSHLPRAAQPKRYR